MKVIKAEEEKAAKQEKASGESKKGEKDEAGEEGKEEAEEKPKENEESKGEEAEEVSEEVVDSHRIAALTAMLDDFENILSKNFCQFANYEDFSFAKSRTTEALQE